MATVNFLYRSVKDKANLKLRLLYRYNETDFVFEAKTKVEVTADYWKNIHFAKKKDIDIQNKQSEIKKELLNIEDFILKAFSNTETKRINKEWLTNQMDLYDNPKQEIKEIPNRLIDYIDYYIQCKKVDLTKASLMKYATIKSKLELMEQHYDNEIKIKDVNENFKNDFVAYYQLNSYSQNTTQKELSFIKTFCRHARHNGIETSIQLDSLLLQKAKVEKIYLTFEELEQIEKVTLNTDYLDNARKWLLISCYTGQRVSDFLNFDKSMIRIEDGVKLIEFTQKKTNKIMSLALHPKVIEILENNNGEFPRKISDQRYNEYIKDVCKIAGITTIGKGGKLDSVTNRKVTGHYPKYELVTSHIGRRSFATNFYGKIPTSLLINATGHSTEAMFLEYIGKTQTQQAKELANYW